MSNPNIGPSSRNSVSGKIYPFLLLAYFILSKTYSYHFKSSVRGILLFVIVHCLFCVLCWTLQVLYVWGSQHPPCWTAVFCAVQPILHQVLYIWGRTHPHLQRIIITTRALRARLLCLPSLNQNTLVVIVKSVLQPHPPLKPSSEAANHLKSSTSEAVDHLILWS